MSLEGAGYYFCLSPTSFGLKESIGDGIGSGESTSNVSSSSQGSLYWQYAELQLAPNNVVCLTLYAGIFLLISIDLISVSNLGIRAS